MATERKEIIAFEFSENGDVLGRATWLGPGVVELDFPNPKLRRRFEKFLLGPQDVHGPVLDATNLYQVYPDESKANFAEACLTLTGIYRVERIR